MRFFEFPAEKNNQKTQQLSDLTMETGGIPIRSVVITTWRSGSTFLGDILNSLPGSFYHYEPLANFEIIQIRNETDSRVPQALFNIRKLLKCDYSGSSMENYLTYGKNHTWVFKFNRRLWHLCNLHPQFCYRPDFLTPLCRVFPIHFMKIIRLRLSVSGKLLDDPEFKLKMLLLIRDPRGTLQSRKHENWCIGEKDCDNPSSLCQGMVEDYYAAQLYSKKYPDHFRVVRYEDLSLNPYEITNGILRFYGLPMDSEVIKFLKSHTKVNVGDAYTTYRNSKTAPFHWIKDLSYEEIDTIQNSCSEAMKLWGYKKISNSSFQIDTFDPLLPYSVM
ncbi:uncharacterized protein DMENIID0001_114710 [Sergentomyia squamirostris]